MYRPRQLITGAAVDENRPVIGDAAAAEGEGGGIRRPRRTSSAASFLVSALAWLILVGLAPSALAEEEFLMPDQAFRISGEADGPDAVRVRWEIADGYYMYQSKFGFQADTVGISTGSPSLPEGETKEDEFFGKVQIYRDNVEIRVPVDRATGSGNFLTLEASSQGCADAGLCYPPHRQRILLELPAMAAVAPAAIETASPASAAAPIQGEQSLNALAGFGQSLGLGEEDDILPAEEAFVFSADVAGPDQLQLTWDIAPGTYLYSYTLELALEDAKDVAIGSFERPTGDIKKDSILPDGSVGDVEVYHDRVDLTLPLLRGSSEPTEVTLIAKYQGCADIGICYPPQTQKVNLSLPEALVTAVVPPAAAATPDAGPPSGPVVAEQTGAEALGDEEPVSEQDRIASVLANSGVWVVIAAFFGFGLLLAFTPCVFPMIPILSGIIAGQGPNITTRRAFVLSLVYVLAMALTYTVVGVLAGLFGANLQAAFQNPWVLTSFALIFVLLALSMFGFYDLQLPSSFQSKLAEISNKQEGGTLIGVAIMGLLSALIVGPCVAPPLFGALIYISQTGDAVLGGIALFALSMGMGAPLIAIGTSAGKLLPRAGGWMDAVKAVFGVALLGVAIFMLERILPAAVAMLLWGLLLICSAVYMGALTQLPAGSSGWKKLWKGIGVFLLIYGALMVLGAAAGGKDTVQPLRGLAVGGGGGAAAEASFTRVKTVEDLDREIAKAGALGKPVMLDFYADWCVTCKELERYTFSDPAVIAEMNRFVLLKADVTANDADDQALMQGRFGIPGPPAILFFDTSGSELKGYRLVGFKPADAFVEHLRRAAP
jgi:thioredoxin:protein disulfide reductase